MMTDNEIIEFMKSCMRCTSCYDGIYVALKRGLKLIERQRAEIERLKSEKIVRCGDGERKGDTNAH